MEEQDLSFRIGSKWVGPVGARCFIVAEVGLAHDGSLAAAHAYVDAVAASGADAIKFQCHIAEAESTPDEPWRVPPEWPQDASRYEYWRRTAFTADQWWSLKVHAERLGLLFLCSPFSVEAVRLLDPLMLAWKVPSGEITNEALLEAIRATGKPALLSTGMATLAEVHRAVAMLSQDDYDSVAVLQCTSEYPCRPERLGLNVMTWFRRQYGVAGLSDHSGTTHAGIAAAALGCDVLEVHVKLCDLDRGPDAAASITCTQLAELVRGVRFVEAAGAQVDKDSLAVELTSMRELFMQKHVRKNVRVRAGGQVDTVGS